MRRFWIIVHFSLLALTASASAQVPPHVPGTVCLTPDFWCWAQVQGEPGTQCWCPLVIDPQTGAAKGPMDGGQEGIDFVYGVFG